MRFIVFLFALVAFSSCNINSYIMLRNNRKFEFDEPLKEEREYKIAPNDVMTFRLLTEDGFSLIDGKSNMIGGSQSNQGGSSQSGGAQSGGSGRRLGNQFDVEFNGTVKLPMVGYTKIAGMTIRQAEAYLEEEYSKYFNKPYAIVGVTSKRAIVFNGTGGNASIVNLTYNNTTLMEVLAQSGGVTQNGRANKIKLVRKVEGKVEVYRIDLSRVENLEDADLAIQGGDIIYVEPRRNYVTQVLREITPYLSVIATAISTIALVNSLSK